MGIFDHSSRSAAHTGPSARWRSVIRHPRECLSTALEGMSGAVKCMLMLYCISVLLKLWVMFLNVFKELQRDP